MGTADMKVEQVQVAERSVARMHIATDGDEAATTKPEPTRARSGLRVEVVKVGDYELIKSPNFLSKSECSDAIARLDGQAHLVKHHKLRGRDTETLLVTDPELAQQLDRRVLEALDTASRKTMNIGDSVEDVKAFGFGSHGTWQAIGTSGRWEIQRYQPAQGYINRHEDAVYCQDLDHATFMSVLIYLNHGDFAQGQTAFYRQGEDDQPLHNEFPRAGKLIMFRAGSVTHEGRRPQGGAKIILKTDVLFQRVSEPLSTNVTHLIKEHARLESVTEPTMPQMKQLSRLYRQQPALEMGGSLLTTGLPLPAPGAHR